MTPEELRALLEKAVAQVEEQKTLNTKNAEQIKELQTGLDAALESKDDQAIEDLKNEIADLQAKYVAPSAVLPQDQKEAVREFAMKSINDFISKSAPLNGKGVAHGHTAFASYFDAALVDGAKTLGLVGANDGTGAGSAATAVQEVLAMDLIEYARELSPILGQIGVRQGLTRDYRELVLSKYPATADGIENVAGTDFPATATQEYGQVKSDVLKIMSNAPITDEAFFGTTYNVYSDLLRLLGDQYGVDMSVKVLYGDGGDKNGRGILASGRLDITDASGESWKPSMAADPADARSHEYFPAISTGVSGGLGSDDAALIALLLKVTRALPQKYRANAKFHMTEDTYSVFENVRDTTGRPLLTNSFMDSSEDRLRGKPVVFDDTLPQLAADAPVMIYGDLSKAFAMANGDIDYMQINTTKKQGVRYVEHNKEMFTIIQASDAIVIVVATTNAPAP